MNLCVEPSGRLLGSPHSSRFIRVTNSPLSSTVICGPSQTMTAWFHCPAGLMALRQGGDQVVQGAGVVHARAAGIVDGHLDAVEADILPRLDRDRKGPHEDAAVAALGDLKVEREDEVVEVLLRHHHVAPQPCGWILPSSTGTLLSCMVQVFQPLSVLPSKSSCQPAAFSSGLSVLSAVSRRRTRMLR